MRTILAVLVVFFSSMNALATSYIAGDAGNLSYSNGSGEWTTRILWLAHYGGDPCMYPTTFTTASLLTTCIRAARSLPITKISPVPRRVMVEGSGSTNWTDDTVICPELKLYRDRPMNVHGQREEFSTAGQVRAGLQIPGPSEAGKRHAVLSFQNDRRRDQIQRSDQNDAGVLLLLNREVRHR